MAKRKPAQPDSFDVDGFSDSPSHSSASPLRVEAMSVEGFENSGKTAFALSSSELGPICYVAMDSGWRTVEWFLGQGRVIKTRKLLVSLDLIAPDIPADDFMGVSLAAMPLLTELRTLCRNAISAGAYAVVIDTGGDLHNLASYAVNGKIGVNVYGGEGRLKAAINTVMEGLFRLFEASDTNLIMTHFLGSFDGNVYPLGWKLVNKECPFVVRCESESDEDDETKPKKFFVRIIKSKYKPELQGQRFKVGRLTAYGKIARMLLPDTTTAGGE